MISIRAPITTPGLPAYSLPYYLAIDPRHHCARQDKDRNRFLVLVAYIQTQDGHHEGVVTMNFPVELDDWIENQKASEDGCDMYGLQPFPPVPGGDC